VHLAGSLLHKL